jgi:large-conductance mechanosensitive channel
VAIAVFRADQAGEPAEAREVKPAAPAEPPKQEVLLTEIRDALRERR